MAYPEKLLKNLSHDEKERVLLAVHNGGYKYNEYGECLLSEEDEGEEDYSQYFATDEIERFRKEKEVYRRELLTHD